MPSDILREVAAVKSRPSRRKRGFAGDFAVRTYYFLRRSCMLALRHVARLVEGDQIIIHKRKTFINHFRPLPSLSLRMEKEQHDLA